MLVKNTTLIRHQTDTSLASVLGYAVFIQHVYCQSLPAAIADGRVGLSPPVIFIILTGVAPHAVIVPACVHTLTTWRPPLCRFPALPPV